MKLGKKKLKELARKIKISCLREKREMIKIRLSLEIIKHFIGLDWINENIFPQHPQKTKVSKEDREFLREKDPGSYEWEERISKLAERIYNLQNVKNIEKIYSKIKQNNLFSRFAEIEAASKLYKRGIDFEFSEQKNIKNDGTYDIKIKSPKEIPCEVKHKSENTKLSERTIESKIKEAKKQVPKNKELLIFMKIPENWLKNPKLKKIIESIKKKHLKEDSRLVGIVFIWEERHAKRQEVFVWKIKVEKRKNIQDGDLNNLVKKLDSAPRKWEKIDNFI